jgi:Flp pilus assembly protein CpaB
VLAVGQDNIASPDPGKSSDSSKKSSAQKGDGRMVTLLLDPQQAQSLQVAILSGTTTLTLRNPMDQESVAIQETRLRDLSGSTAGMELAKSAASSMKSSLAELWRAFSEKASANAAQPRVEVAMKPNAPATQPTWDTLIIRGPISEVRSFPMPAKRNVEAAIAGSEETH